MLESYSFDLDKIKMSSERAQAILNLEEPDRVPYFLVPSLHYYGIKMLGISFREYHSDMRKMLKSQLIEIKLAIKIGGEPFWLPLSPLSTVPRLWPDFGTMAIPSGFCEIVFPENRPPYPVHPVLKSPEDVEKLDIPDIYEHGLGPRIIETLSFLKREVGDKQDIIRIEGAWTNGPFNNALLLRGYQQLVIDMYRNPRYYHKVMGVVTETMTRWTREMLGELGISRLSMVSGGSSEDATEILSPEAYRTMVLPYVSEFAKNFGSFWVHNCSRNRCMHLVEEYARIPGIRGMDVNVDAGEAKRRVGDKLCIVSFIDPWHDIQMKNDKEILQICKERIRKGAPGGGYGLSSGEPLVTTYLDKLEMIMKAVRKHGTYPL